MESKEVLIGSVPREIAEKEVTAWLDFKNIKPKKREEKKREIEELIEGVEDGSFVIDPETKVIKFKLSFPIENDKKVVTIKELEFQPRVNTAKIQQALMGTNVSDTMAWIYAYLQVLTGQPKSIFGHLDSEDYNMVRRIAVFFM